MKKKPKNDVPVGADRFDPAPLIDLFADMSTASQMLGVTPRSLQRWRETGLPWGKADALAVKVGFHPSDLWPDWFDSSLADDDGRPLIDQLALFGGNL